MTLEKADNRIHAFKNPELTLNESEIIAEKNSEAIGEQIAAQCQKKRYDCRAV